MFPVVGEVTYDLISTHPTPSDPLASWHLLAKFYIVNRTILHAGQSRKERDGLWANSHIRWIAQTGGGTPHPESGRTKTRRVVMI